MIGPTAEIQNALLRGGRASFSIAVTPPMKCSVMERTGSPKRCAMIAWEISWSSRDRVSSTAKASPRTWRAPSPGDTCSSRVRPHVGDGAGHEQPGGGDRDVDPRQLGRSAPRPGSCAGPERPVPLSRFGHTPPTSRISNLCPPGGAHLSEGAPRLTRMGTARYHPGPGADPGADPGRRGGRGRLALAEPGRRLHDLSAALPLPHHRQDPRVAVAGRAARHGRPQGPGGPLRPARPPTGRRSVPHDLLEPDLGGGCSGRGARVAELFAGGEGGPEVAGGWSRAGRGLARYFTLEDPRRLEPAERELYVETVLDSKLLLRGFVDRLDVAPDRRGSAWSTTKAWRSIRRCRRRPAGRRWGPSRSGTLVVGSDGNPTLVTLKSGIHDRPCFRISFGDGTSVVCDNVHLWRVVTSRRQQTAGIHDVLDAQTPFSERHQPAGAEEGRELDVGGLRLRRSTLRDVAGLPVDPWLLGAWLGDGDTRGNGVSPWARRTSTTWSRCSRSDGHETFW